MNSIQLPTFVGHRGYPLKYPDNTLSGFQAAIEAGAAFIECDVQLTRDMVPVLFHDRDLTRVCGLPGAIHEFDFHTLQKIAANEQIRFGERFLHEPIATLEQLLACIRSHPAVTVFVELKRSSLNHFGRKRCTKTVMDLLYGFEQQAVIISYDLDALALVKKTGWQKIGAVCDRWEDADAKSVLALNPGYIFFDIRGLPDTGRLDTRHAKTVVFEVADWTTACALTARGASLIETFAIEEMLELKNTAVLKPHG